MVPEQEGGAGINKNPTRTQHSGCGHELSERGFWLFPPRPVTSCSDPIITSRSCRHPVTCAASLSFLRTLPLPFSRSAVDNSTASSSRPHIRFLTLLLLLLCYVSPQGRVGQRRLCDYLRLRQRGNPPGWARHEVRESGEPGQLGDMDLVRGRNRFPDAPRVEQNTSPPRPVVG